MKFLLKKKAKIILNLHVGSSFATCYLYLHIYLFLEVLIMIKLFIVGFPRDMEEIELVEMFSAYGTVHTITIITDKFTGKSLGYGFIMMTDQAGADRAIAAMDGAEIDGRQISVRVAVDKRVPAEKAYAPAPKSPAPKTGYKKVEPSNNSAPEIKKKRPRRAV
jgi:RNA recognition motif-containing protein